MYFRLIQIDFYSDFTQLKYVYAEIENIIDPETIKEQTNLENTPTNTERIKLDLINEEVEIFKESNLKFIEENENLKKDNNNLIKELSILKKENELQKNVINQNNIDKEELEFLRLNLIYSHKCQSKKLFSSGYKVGTKEYKECIMRKGKLLND